MATSLYIYSKMTSEALQREGRYGLEDDLEEFLTGAGETTGAGAMVNGPGWNIDLELTDDDHLEEWITRLVAFLRDWGVPPDTYFTVYPDNWVEGMEERRVEVFPKPKPPSPVA